VDLADLAYLVVISLRVMVIRLGMGDLVPGIRVLGVRNHRSRDGRGVGYLPEMFSAMNFRGWEICVYKDLCEHLV
jgi:hypothetical protein